MEDTVQRLQEVCRKVFRQKEFLYKESLSAKDVKGWDSFAYIQLIVGIEKEFKVKLPAGQVVQLKNLGELLALVKSKLGST